MKTNEIHAEIRTTRDALMHACGGDLARFAEQRRAAEPRWAAAGHPIVSFEGQPPLELPPVDWEKLDALPENEIIAEIRATRRALAAEREIKPAEEPESFILREDPPKP